VLAADHRLRHSDAFRRTVKSGRRAGSPALVLHLLVDGSLEGEAPKVGFVVSKGVGSAVERNLVKRRLRHVVRDFLTTLPPSSELVVRAEPVAAGMTSAELRVALARCLQRVGVADPEAAGSGSGAGS
jgi:ribonuclease P protein component